MYTRALLSCTLLWGAVHAYAQPAVLSADGQGDAYTLIKSVLGASPETPDCSHPDFGPHIVEGPDSELGKPVFLFRIHVVPDNDRCSAFDRQRLEIKTDGGSPAYVKGYRGDTVTFRWRFRLPEGFQPTANFTHIHQIKAYDGDADSPIITLTPRKATPNKLQVIWSGGTGGGGATFTEVPLAPFLGNWVEAYEKLTYGANGTYSVAIRRMRDGAVLLSYANNNVNLWRSGTTVVRPKWGIYRSLNSMSDLRDEEVRFDRFCLAKDTGDCSAEQTPAPFTFSLAPGAAGFTATVTAAPGFAGPVNLSVSGLPAGAAGAFSPASLTGSGSSTLTVTTGGNTPPGTYNLLATAVGPNFNQSATAVLKVAGAGALPAIQTVNNGAGFGTDFAPGAWISIFGANLAASTRAWTGGDMAGNKLPVQLDGVSVTVDGKAAAVAYISPGQLNVQVPTDVLAGPPVLVQVTTPQGASSVTAAAQPFAPALFRLSAENARYAAAQHAGDFATVGKPGLYPDSRPARPGETIVLYGTGFGPTTPAVPSGQAVAKAAPLTNSLAVWIGGAPAEVSWAGIVAPGLYQLNVKVPGALPDGDAAVVAEVAGVRTSGSASITVAGQV